MYLNAHCRTIFMSDLDSWDSVNAKNGLTHLDWTPDTRDTKCVLKWVLARIDAFCCASWPQIWISEIEYYHKVSSHAHILPRWVVFVGAGWWVVYRSKTITAPAPRWAKQSRAGALERSLSITYFPFQIETFIKNNINLGLGWPSGSQDNVIYNISHWKKCSHLDQNEKLNVR